MFGVCFVIIVGSLLRSELVAKLEGRKRIIEFQYAHHWSWSHRFAGPEIKRQRTLSGFPEQRCAQGGTSRRRYSSDCKSFLALLGNYSHALAIALWCAGRTGRSRSRGRVAGDKGEHSHQSQFDNPAECRVREPGGNGSGLGGRRQSCWLRTAGGFAVASCWGVHKRRTFREQRRRVQ